ncbi:MAG: VCBS repeat-containing protein [Ignavibacteria bacterium]|nr:VCBS repeat-containing protein [Ignavibacteria bacterium]
MKTSITTIPFIFIVSLLSIFSGYSFSYIQDVSPLVNSQNLDTKGNITVRFLYEMNAATLNDETVILNGSQSGRIHTLVTYNATTRTATIDPVRDLKAGETVQADLTSGIYSVYGPIQRYIYSFKVKPTGGSGIFPETVTSQLGAGNFSGLNSGDFDGDGDLDLCVLRNENGSNNLYIFKNDGAGSFIDTSLKTIISSAITSMRFGDYDNDGDIDAAGFEHNWNTNPMTIFKNNGSGEFSYHSVFNTSYDIKAIEQADIDNDGDIDFITLNSHSIHQYRNNGNGVFEDYTYFVIGCQYYYFNFGYMTVDDFDGDNDQDIYYMGQFREEEPGYNCYETRIYINNGGGGFDRYFINNPFSPAWMVTYDLNNDRKTDIIMPPNRMLLFVHFINFSTHPYPGSETAGDFDGDGDLDLIIAGSYNTQPVIYFNDGSGNFSAGSVLNPESQGGGFPMGDFDNDGDLDIIKSGFAPGEIMVLKNYSYCTISGPAVINLDSTMIRYFCSDIEGYWILTNNQQCNASIAGNNNDDTVFVNAGNSTGSFNLNFYLPDNTLHCSRVISVDDPMPVELSSFYSVVNKRDVSLNWTTSFELNNFGFDIERQFINSDDNQWKKIGFVQGRGNVTAGSEYKYEDKNLMSGNYNYRLKQTDVNGGFVYYELDDEVIIGIPQKFDLSQNYPNPFNPVTVINFDIAEKSFVTLKIYDNTGREIASLVDEFKPAGYYTVTFNASGFASGVYYYRLTSDKFYSTKKLILIK